MLSGQMCNQNLQCNRDEIVKKFFIILIIKRYQRQLSHEFHFIKDNLFIL